MKMRALLLCLATLALCAAPAAAQFPVDIPGQLFLGWEDCLGGPSPIGPDKILICSNYSAQDRLYASMAQTTGGDVNGIIADLGVMDVVALSVVTLPDFWRFDNSGCNGPLNWQFGYHPTPGPNPGCADMWDGVAGGGGQYDPPSGNTSRVRWTMAVNDPAIALTMPNATETYMQDFTIKHAKAGVCAGCEERICFVYQEEKLSLIDGTILRVSNPGNATANCGYTPHNCPGATPTQSKSWGQLKSLYR